MVADGTVSTIAVFGLQVDVFITVANSLIIFLTDCIGGSGTLVATTMWSDKWEGLDNPVPEHEYPEAYAENLQGKLLMIHGMLDTCVPPAIVFRMVEALQKANKDFDLVLLPSMGHSTTGYGIRRAWDYLVEHLQGNEPPKEFKLTMAFE